MALSVWLGVGWHCLCGFVWNGIVCVARCGMALSVWLGVGWHCLCG